MVGSVLGVLFISLVRRVMVEDPELPFPESVAASEIHKAGQRGAEAAKYLFWNIGVGGVVYMLGTLRIVCRRQRSSLRRRQSGPQPGSSRRRWEAPMCSPQEAPAFSRRPASVRPISAWATSSESGWHRSSLRAACWRGDLLVPLLIFFLGPQLQAYLPADTPDNWAGMADAVWRYIVRPIAVGGMLVGAAYTLIQNAQEPDRRTRQGIRRLASDRGPTEPSWPAPNAT